MENKQILIADTPEAIQLISNILGAGVSIVSCIRLEEAKEALSGKIDLIVCGAHFDDCKMYEFLRYSKIIQNAKSVPFLCVRVLEGELDDTLYQSVKIATKALGAAGFIDLFRWQRSFGDTEAFIKLQAVVESLSANPVED